MRLRGYPGISASPIKHALNLGGVRGGGGTNTTLNHNSLPNYGDSDGKGCDTSTWWPSQTCLIWTLFGLNLDTQKVSITLSTG